MAEQLLTIEEAAKLLGLTRQGMYSARARGTGPPAYRLGPGPRSQLRYRASDIDAWLERHRDDPADRLTPTG